MIFGLGKGQDLVGLVLIDAFIYYFTIFAYSKEE
jgi:hypothetical protein